MRPQQALHNVTSMTRVTTVSAFQTLSYIAEGCIFIYVGLDTLDPLKWTVRVDESPANSHSKSLYPSWHRGPQTPRSGHMCGSLQEVLTLGMTPNSCCGCPLSRTRQVRGVHL